MKKSLLSLMGLALVFTFSLGITEKVDNPKNNKVSLMAEGDVGG
ncbi:hypothetical protein [Bacillus manliponensis]|nr:hypothetical protein [Bacillus manliponensis]